MSTTNNETAPQILGRINTLAALRHQCWCAGDTTTAKRLTADLAADWVKLRQKRYDVRDQQTSHAVTDRPPQRNQYDRDPVARFLAEQCVSDPDATTPTRDVHDAYQRWARDEWETPISAKKLTIELRRHGVEPCRTKRSRLYRGVRVTDRALTAELDLKLGRWMSK